MRREFTVMKNIVDLTKWQKVIYYLGKHSMTVRWFYWHMSECKYLWGISNYLKDDF